MHYFVREKLKRKGKKKEHENENEHEIEIEKNVERWTNCARAAGWKW
jgi:hypothetical protein